MLSLIAVIGKNRELGKDDKLLWYIPGDLPRFKSLTLNHPIIMGRKTYESLPKKPLSGRTNIVISSNPSFSAPGAIVVASLDVALSEALQSGGAEEIFVIGGGSIYKLALEKADRLYLTVVDATAPADTFFPEYSQFSKVISQENHTEGGFRYTYLTLEK